MVDSVENLNLAAQDLLDLLSMDGKNRAAGVLLRSIREKHCSKKTSENTALAKALSGIESEDREKYLKLLLGVLSNDLSSSCMELGRKEGVKLLWKVATSVSGEGTHDCVCAVLALQCLSCACSYPPFARRYVNSDTIHPKDVLPFLEEDKYSEEIGTAAVALLLRLYLSREDFSHDDVVLRIVCSSLSPAKDGNDHSILRSGLDLLSTWTNPDFDSVLHAAEEAGDFRPGTYVKKKVTPEELRLMKPRELSAHKQGEFERMMFFQKRAKDHVRLFCREGGLEVLLECAVGLKDHQRRREVGLALARMMNTLQDERDEKESEKEIHKMVGQILGFEDDSGGLTIEEIFDEDDEKEEAADCLKEDFVECLQRGQLVSSLLLCSQTEIGIWAFQNAWSNGDGVSQVKRLVHSDDEIAMSIASEILSGLASIEKGRGLLSPFIRDLDTLLECGVREVTSGAASAWAKMGLAEKAGEMVDEGEVMGILQVAVTLLEEDDYYLEGDADRKVTSAIERGVEVLSYLMSKTSVKEEIAHGFRSSAKSTETAMERLVKLANQQQSNSKSESSSVLSYGIASIFAHMAISVETLRREAFADKDITPEQFDQMQALGKTDEEKERLQQKMPDQVQDTDDMVRERIQKMANSNVPRAIVHLLQTCTSSGPTGENTVEQCILTMLRLAEQSTVRGLMIQQGCLSACIKTQKSDNPSDSSNKILRNSRHCIAKILVTTNPSLLTSSQRLGSIPPLIELIRDVDASDLSHFESLLSITNLASHNDEETKNRIVAEKGLATLNYAMYSDHPRIRSAATEAVTNLIPHPDTLRPFLEDEQTPKLWIAFASDFRENPTCARAAAGALAMLSQHDKIAARLCDCPNLEPALKELLECGDLDLLHRALVLITNMLGHGGKCEESMTRSGSLAFCRAYADSYGGKRDGDDLGFSEEDEKKMGVTLDLAKSIVRSFG